MNFLNCELSAPVEIATSSYQFSKLDCSSTALVEIAGVDSTTTFWLAKTYSVADFIIIFFLAVIILMSIFDFIQRFIYKIKVNFKH